MQKFQTCKQATDCVYASNGCCDCANGGEAVAINQDQKNDFAEEFNCSTVACTLVAAEPACNVGTITCEDNLCKFTRP